VGLAHEGAAGEGRAVQVDPIKPTLKAPGYARLKLKCDDMLSNFAFKLNLRRYMRALLPFHFPHADYSVWAGAYTRPLFSST